MHGDPSGLGPHCSFWCWEAPLLAESPGSPPRPNPAVPQDLKCDNGTFRQAKVTTRVQLDVAGLDHPCVISDLEITVPRSTPGSEFLLASPSSETGRAALACLLGDGRSPLEVRQSPPKVATRDGAVVVTHHSYADVLSTNVVWVDLARIEVDTTGQPWLLTIHAPWGLRFAKWDVTLVAPEGWLSDPWPSNPVEVSTIQLRWPASTPAASRDGKTGAEISHVVVSAKLKPDTKSSFAAAAADRQHKPFAWGAYWLSALVSALYSAPDCSQGSLTSAARSTAMVQVAMAASWWPRLASPKPCRVRQTTSRMCPASSAALAPRNCEHTSSPAV